MTVAEYAAKFIQLSCCASEFVAEEVKKSHRFQLGLRLTIQAKMGLNKST